MKADATALIDSMLIVHEFWFNSAWMDQEGTYQMKEFRAMVEEVLTHKRVESMVRGEMQMQP